MQVFIVNASGKIIIDQENTKLNLKSFANKLLIEVEDGESAEVETLYNDYVAEGKKVIEVPILWNGTGACNINVKHNKKIIRYQFILDNIAKPEDDEKQILYDFSAQLENNYRLEADYPVEQLFTDIKNNKIPLLVERRPYVGYDDTSLLKKIEIVIPMIMDICTHPKQNLRTEETILDVSLVKRVNSRTLDHLAAHSEHWKSRGLNGLTPNRLRAEVLEDDINIYENLFFRMAVDDILRYVHSQALSIRKTIDQNVSAIDWNIYGQELSDYKRMEIFSKLLPNYNVDDKQIENAKLQELLNQWESLEKHFSTVEASQFFRSIDKKRHISRSIRPTNIIKKDSRYNALYRLWCDIQRNIVQVQNESSGLSRNELYPLSSSYATYSSVLLLYAFELLGYSISKESKFRITMDGQILLDALFTSEHMDYVVKSDINEYGLAEINVRYIEHIEYKYEIPDFALVYMDNIKENSSAGMTINESYIIFSEKPKEEDIRKLKNTFHLSKTEKKKLNSKEIQEIDEVDEKWRISLEEYFVSNKISEPRFREIKILPMYSFIEATEAAVNQFTTQQLSELTEGTLILLPIDIRGYHNNVLPEKYLYRLLNYGEKYIGDDATAWGNYRTGILPVSQIEINSAQRLMKLISLYTSKQLIVWSNQKIICPICGSTDCTAEGADSWTCNDSSCRTLFGRTIHAEGCGKVYEWTRPQKEIKKKEIIKNDLLKQMLRKESIFDRLAITDFEFEEQANGKIKYVPVCPICGERPKIG